MDFWLLASTAGLVIGLAVTWSSYSKSFRKDEEKERTRLRNEVLGAGSTIVDTVVVSGSVGQESTSVNIGPDRDAPKEIPQEAISSADGSAQERQTQPTAVQHKGHNARFAILLVDYYAYGLTQARRSFAVSLFFSMLGGIVLVAGVALAIFRADTNGQAYAAIVTSVAGVLTSSIGVLFHRQAARALKHMEEQTNKLRQDMKAEREVDASVDLLDRVADTDLRSWLQAALILRFSGAKLPNIDRLAQPHPLADSLDRHRGSRKRPVKLDNQDSTTAESDRPAI